jgi:CBS domain-containing protein
MGLLREMELVAVSVDEEAPFLEAARLLLVAHTSALAVVDETNRVVGLFTDDDLLRGLFPRYLGELRHTSFLVDGGEPLQASAESVAHEAVARYMRESVTVEIDSAPAHVVERFLHTPWGALAVVENGHFVGMVGQLEFTERLLERLDFPRG